MRVRTLTLFMPQAIWKGNISFGLVSVPVVLRSAEKRSEEIKFNLLDRRDQSRIRYERINDQTGEAVPWSEIVKAYEYDENDYVILTPDDFKKAAVEASQTIDIETFVDEADIDPMYYERPYFLVPGKKGEKGYVLLREALKRTGKIGIAKVVIRTRQYLAALLSRGDALVLDVLRFSHELRSPDDLDLPAEEPTRYKITAREIQLAQQLIDSMGGEWEPEQYKDEYYEALRKWIDRKIAAGGKDIAEDVEDVEREPEPRVINIADLLQQSMKNFERAAPHKATRRKVSTSARKRKKSA